jgi:hypothetical protein
MTMSKKLNIQPIISSGYREVKDGSKYDKYFPKVDQKQRMIVGDRSAEVEDVVKHMQAVVLQYQDDTKLIAQKLKASNLKQTISNIWHFLYHHIQYKLDKSGLEELRRPARLWHDKEGDCDDFAMAASSILNNLGIENAFRITKYSKDYFQHVYVVVPDGMGDYYKIDPVLSMPNYEKPFTEKKDFTMSLNGINVAVLSGFGSTDSRVIENMLLTDLDLQGLGSLTDEQADQRMYSYLLSTRSFVSKNKSAVAAYENPDKFIQSLDYAIKYWHTPQRAKALAILEQNEAKENRAMQMQGLLSGNDEDDWDDIEGLDDDYVAQFLTEFELDGIGAFWHNKKKRKALRAKRKERRAKRKAKRKVRRKKFWGNVKKGLKKVGKFVNRFNPGVAAIRGGILLVLKLGIFPFPKFKKRLKWAYATDAQLQKAKVKSSYRAKAQSVLARLEKVFEGMGGKKKNLRKAILHGKKGQLTGFEDEQVITLEGLGDGGISAGAMIAAATAVLTTINKLFKKKNLGDKETTDGAPSPSSHSDSEGITADDVERLVQSGAKIIEKVNGKKHVQKPVQNTDGSTSYESIPIKETSKDVNLPEAHQQIPEAMDLKAQRSEAKGFIPFIKKNPLVAFLGVGVLSGLTYLGIRSSKKKTKQSLSGHTAAKKTKQEDKPKPKTLKVELLK